MSVFVDTGVFYAHHDRDAPRHEAAKDAFLSVLRDGRYGSLFTSDYVYDETVTLTRSHTGRFEDAKAAGDRILGRAGFPEVVTLLRVTDELFDVAVETFERYDDHALSFTDATSVALVEYHDVDHLLTFDDDFEGLVERLDPADLAVE